MEKMEENYQTPKVEENKSGEAKLVSEEEKSQPVYKG